MTKTIKYNNGRGPCYLKQISHLFKSKNKRSRTLFSFVLSLICVLFSSAQAQSGRTLQGEVRSAADGHVLKGASIYAEKTGEKASTGLGGKFSLRVNAGAGTIQIKHIGFKEQSVAYDEKTTLLEIRLQPADNEIEEVEVVSTGYQTIPKERSTGSFVQIDNELLNRRVATNILDKLDGIAPGLQFDNRGSKPMVNIRGINTMSSGLLEPLIVLDNFPYDGKIENINPNDVESVTLLKDAAAASIWGARAGNGVIVITTKKSKLNGKQTLHFISNSTLIEKPDIYYTPVMNSSSFIDVEQFLFEKGFYNAHLNGTNARFFVVSPVVSYLDAIDKGTLSEDEGLRAIASLRQNDYRDDMYEHFYRRGYNQQNQLSWGYGSESFSNRLSIGWDKNHRWLRGNETGRLSLRYQAMYKPKKWLEVEPLITLTSAQGQSDGTLTYPINPAGGKLRLYPYAQLVGEEGAGLNISRDYNSRYIDNFSEVGDLLDWTYSPYDERKRTERTDDTWDALLGLRTNISLTKNLKVSAQYGYERQQSTNTAYFDVGSYYMRNLINRFTQINNGQVVRRVPLGAQYDNGLGRMESHRLRTQASYDKNFRDRHEISAIAGWEVSDRLNTSRNSRVYGYDRELLTSIAVDYANSYPIYDGLAGNTFIPNGDSFTGTRNRFVSAFANASYTYKRQLVLTASTRRDGSNLFGVNTNDKWKPLWSAGVGYIVSNNAFVQQNLPVIDLLKARLTYGHSGNSGGGTAYPLIVYRTNSVYTNLPYAIVSRPANPNLKWEDVAMFNAGIDFAILNNRISGSVEYFRKRSSDLLADDPIDPTTGLNTALRNVGKIDGKGVDIQVNIDLIQKSSFSWNTSLAFSAVNDRVTEYKGTVSASSNYVTNGGKLLTSLVDKSLYPVFSYRFEGLDGENGDPIGFLNGENSRDYARLLNDSLQNLNYHGSGLPPQYGFWRNMIRYRKASLSWAVVYKFGHYFRKETVRYAALYNNWDTHHDYETRWQNPGDELHTTVPSMIYPANANRDSFYAGSSPNIERGDIIKLQDCMLSYLLFDKAGKSMPRISVSLAAHNVAVLWRANKSGLDPDFDNLPAQRSWALSLSANF